MLSRIVIVCLLAFILAACGADEAPSPQAADETSAADQQRPAAAQAESEEEAPMSEFLADSLHPIEPAAPGRFRLEVAGEVHEGELGSCGWFMRVDDGDNQDRFSATANWRAEDGRSMALDMWRFVMHDDFFWNASHGHESDRVQLRLRDGGGSLINVQDTAVSQMSGIRTQPGANPRWRWGSGEMPAVRVSTSGPQATAVGELHGEANEHGSPLTGPFELAVHCAED